MPMAIKLAVLPCGLGYPGPKLMLYLYPFHNPLRRYQSRLKNWPGFHADWGGWRGLVII